MKNNSLTFRKQGFTLIELLIVVVILGILAAVVIPQLSGVTEDAKTESLRTNLANIRTAIEMYEYEHGVYPGAVASGTTGTCGTGGTLGNGGIDTPEAVANQLTMYTSAAGEACSVKDSTYTFGPYLKTTATGVAGFPDNAVTGVNTIVMQLTGNLIMTSASTTGGWKYDNISGKIIADHTDYDDL